MHKNFKGAPFFNQEKKKGNKNKILKRKLKKRNYNKIWGKIENYLIRPKKT